MMKKIGAIFLLTAFFFIAGCSLFGQQSTAQKGGSLLEQLGGSRSSKAQEPSQPLPSDANADLENIPFSVIDPFDFLRGNQSAFDVLEYDETYFAENPGTELLEKYKGFGKVELPFVKEKTEFYASVQTDYDFVSQYYVFQDNVTLDEKLALYNALCETAADRYGTIDEGYYHYYYMGGKERTEDLSFYDETIKALMAATPDGDYEFSRAWDPVEDSMRLVIALSPNVVMEHQNGDIGVFIYSYNDIAAPTPTPAPTPTATPKPASTPVPASQKIMSGAYYPLEGGTPFLYINGTSLTVDYGDDNVWQFTIEISGNKAFMIDDGKFGNATFEQIDSETIVVENNYFGGAYTLN